MHGKPRPASGLAEAPGPEIAAPEVAGSAPRGRSALLAGYGESQLALQNIPLAGAGRVQVHGSRIPPDHGVWFAGDPVPVDERGRFVAERLLPPGTHTVEVAVVDPEGNIAGKYRKVHLPGHREHEPDFPFQHLEKRYFETGNLGFPVFNTLGGKVGKAATPEVGVLEVARTDDGRASPFYDGLPERGACLQWHGAEVLEPPADALEVSIDAAPEEIAARIKLGLGL